MAEEYLSTDPNFGMEPEGSNPAPLGGMEAKMSALPPEEPASLWATAREAISKALFGDSEARSEAKAAGIATETTPAEMASGLMMASAPLGLGAVAKLPLGAAAKAVGKMVAGGAAGGYAGARGGREIGNLVGEGDAGAAIGGTLGSIIGGTPGGRAQLAEAAVSRVGKLADLAQAVSAATKGARAAETAKTVSTAAKALSPAAEAALPLAERMKASVLMWKNQHKLSGAQTARFLRETYGKEVDGLTMSQAQKIVNTILEAK